MRQRVVTSLLACLGTIGMLVALAPAAGLFTTKSFTLVSQHIIYRADGVTKVSEASDMTYNTRTGELVVMEQLNRMIFIDPLTAETTHEVTITAPPNNDWEGLGYQGDDGVNDYYAAAFEGSATVYWITVPFGATSIAPPTDSYRIFRVDSAPAWVSATSYAVNSFIQLSGDPLRILRCVTAGTSGTTEPVWPAGNTVIDGTVTWTKGYDAGIEALCVNPTDVTDSRCFRYDIGGLKSYRIMQLPSHSQQTLFFNKTPTNVRAATWNEWTNTIIVCSSNTSNFRLHEISPSTGVILSQSPQYLWSSRKFEGVVFTDADNFWVCAEAGGDLDRLFHYRAQ